MVVVVRVTVNLIICPEAKDKRAVKMEKTALNWKKSGQIQKKNGEEKNNFEDELLKKSMRSPRCIQTVIRSLAPPPLQFEAYLIRAGIEAAFHPHTSEHAKADKTPTDMRF